MKLNLKIIIPLVVIVAISWIGNVYMFNRYSIQKPIFIRTYLSYYSNEEPGFQLYYISNSYDKDTVCSVNFPEIKTEPVYVETKAFNEISNSSYVINSVQINFKNIFTENGRPLSEVLSDKKSINLSKIVLSTISGKTYKYDLGQLCLEQYNPINDNSIVTESGESSNQGLFRDTFKTKQNVSLTGLEGPFKELIPEIFDISINGKKLNNTGYLGNFKGGEKIEIEAQMKEKDQLPPQYRFAYIQMRFSLKGSDSSGRPCEAENYINSQRFYYITAKDVRRMINESR
ncbi:MAG TPA: hypothetical protein VHP38_02485 [Ruminiclostridium sp.]|nr:hypothetical protein [Ruminiclostridium sp.]